MEIVTRKTLGELHTHFELYDPQFTVYRGVSSMDYKLISTLGRIELKENGTSNQFGTHTN